MARFSSKRTRTFGGRKPYILLLCTGNTCRSPMAYGIIRKLFDEMGSHEVDVRTAGVMTIPGLLPTQECRQILVKDNMDISNHRSSKMTPEILRRANLILGMTSFHVQMALRMCEEARGKTYLLKEYIGANVKNAQIQDPMGCTLEVYKKVYRDIKKACKRLVEMDLLTPAPPAPRRKSTSPDKELDASSDDDAPDVAEKEETLQPEESAKATPESSPTDSKPKKSPQKPTAAKKETKKKSPAAKKEKKAAASKKETKNKPATAKKETKKKPAAKKSPKPPKKTTKKKTPPPPPKKSALSKKKPE